MPETGTPKRQRGLLVRGIDGLVNRATPTVLDMIDLDEIIQHLDVNLIAERLDLDQLMDRLDINAIANRLDLEQLMDRLDINEIADRLDLDQLIDRIDIAPLVGKSTAGVAEGGIDLARRQIIRFDVIGTAVAMRLTGRRLEELPLEPGPDPTQPPSPAEPSGESTDTAVGHATTSDAVEQSEPDTAPGSQDPDDLQDHYAGPLSRLLAAVIDSFGSVAAFGLVGSILAFFIRYLFSPEFDSTDGNGWVRAVLLLAWLFAWYWVGQATVGRTPGKVVLGLRAVQRHGEPLGPGRAAIRVLVLPISYIIFGLGFVGIVFGRERRALHDVAAGSTVIYDWGERRAKLPRMRLVTTKPAPPGT